MDELLLELNRLLFFHKVNPNKETNDNTNKNSNEISNRLKLLNDKRIINYDKIYLNKEIIDL
jgi:hypothetical protein